MKKIILAIETSSNICSVSLFRDGNNIDLIENLINKKHDELLSEYTQSILKNNQLKVIDIDTISVSIGPGSFTGLRVGLSFAKGIAYAIKCSIIPVPTILSLAYSLKDKEPLNGIIHSHGNKVFFQEFNWDKGIPSIKNKPILGNINDFKDKIRYGFQYNCGKMLKNRNDVFNVKPSSINIGALSYLYYSEWNNPKPHDLISDYFYPYKIK